MRKRTSSILVIGLALVALSAWAAQNWSVHLTGDQEVPPNDSRAQGQLTLKLSDDGQSIDFKLTIANIEDVRAAHLHVAPSDSTGPVVVNLYTGPKKEGRYQGRLAEGTFTSADLVGPLQGQTLADLVAAIEAGRIYVNVHTDAYPPGEIRAQVE